MKKLILPLLVAGAFAAPSMAQAASNSYVSLSSGLSLLNNSSAEALGVTVKDVVTYKTGYLFNGAVGMKNDNVRVEAEVGYHRNSIDKALSDSTIPPSLQPVTGVNLSMWTFMANAYYDFNMKDSSITPFVMGGLGLADLKIKGDGTDESKTRFAWQLGAGIGIKASNSVTVDLGYRYLKPSAPSFDLPAGLGSGKLTFGGSEILAGVRIGI
jgi:opacity protein-like surface antigen